MTPPPTLPDFLVIGAMKGGTATLCALLEAHPDVTISKPRETYFFSHDDRYAKGLEWYASLFSPPDDADDSHRLGEGTTLYSAHPDFPDAPERIAKHLPRARLIYLVRDPIQRAISHYMHLKGHGAREQRHIDEALTASPEYVNWSRYWRQLQRYREHFDDEQILVLLNDELRNDQAGAIQRALEFIDADPDAWTRPDNFADRNLSESKRVDTPLLRLLRRAPGLSVPARVRGESADDQRTLRRLIPAPLFPLLRRLLKRPAGRRPEPSPETTAWLQRELRDDARRILEYAGQPAERWPWVAGREGRSSAAA